MINQPSEIRPRTTTKKIGLSKLNSFEKVTSIGGPVSKPATSKAVVNAARPAKSSQTTPAV